jgi:polyhydroxybutyrate depolymerase
METPMPDIPARVTMAFMLMMATALAAEAREQTITIGGRERTYSVFRPALLDRRTPVPLVVVLHGGFGTGSQAEKSYHWDDEATAQGFVVAYPDGVRRSWNAGGTCCGLAFKDKVDDVGFLDALIRTVSAAENTDDRRVYVTGISNGAAMAYRYACDGQENVAAIGSVSGTMPGGCSNPRPISVMEIHGLQDQNIPFAGGIGAKGVTHIDWPPVEATLDHFRRADECGKPVIQRKDLVERSDAACAGGRAVSLITIADAGHQWPGAVPEGRFIRRLFRLDAPSTALDATDVLWRFFEGHPAK